MNTRGQTDTKIMDFIVHPGKPAYRLRDSALRWGPRKSQPEMDNTKREPCEPKFSKRISQQQHLNNKIQYQS